MSLMMRTQQTYMPQIPANESDDLLVIRRLIPVLPASAIPPNERTVPVVRKQS